MNSRRPATMVEYVDWEVAYYEPPSDRVANGLLNIGREDWRRVVCPRCRFDWRGTLHDVAHTIRFAQSLKINRAALRRAPLERTAPTVEQAGGYPSEWSGYDW